MSVVRACLPPALLLLIAVACARGGPYGTKDHGGPDVPGAGLDVAIPDLPDAPDLADAGPFPGDEGVVVADVASDPGPSDPGPSDPGAVDVPPSCEPAEPRTPFQVSIQFMGAIDEVPDLVRGAAVVVARGPYPGDAAWNEEVRFRMVADGTEVVVRTQLPDEAVLPVAFGETVNVLFQTEYGFEYVSTFAIVWGSEGRVRFFWHDAPIYETASAPAYDCGDVAPCPRTYFLPADCPPRPGECGDVEYPRVRIDLGPDGPAYDVAQGGTVEDSTGGARVKVVAGAVFRNVTMECVDYPGVWVQVALFDNTRVSQCTCAGAIDCAEGEVCETVVHRCVPDRCIAAGQCADGAECDPYTGKCVDLSDGLAIACDDDGDCPPSAGCGYVCNRLLGICEKGQCCAADCAWGCSDLLGGCFGCLSDCDCFGTGACDRATHVCVDCDTSKLALTRANPEKYEFYEVCIPADYDWDVGSPEATVRAVDPSLYCGVAGGFAKCDPATEVGCHGDLSFDPGGKVILTDKWAQLCALSRLPFVSRIGGGHFVR